MTTKISKITEVFTGNGSGTILSLVVDSETLSMPGTSLGTDASYYVKVVALNTSSDGGGPNGCMTRNADFYSSGGSLTLGTQHTQENFGGNVNISVSAVSDDIQIDLTYVNSFTQTDGRVYVEVYGYSV